MTDPMTPERLAEIRERAMYATDGPWKVDESQRLKDASLRYVIAAEAEDVAAVDVSAEASAWRFHRRAAELDAAFIAHAREDVPALLAEVERLRAELDDAVGEARSDIAGLERLAGRYRLAWQSARRGRKQARDKATPVLVVERDEARAEVEQWRATFGETALRDARNILAERDQLRAAVAGWRDSYERLSRQLLRRHHAWQSARRGRKQARAELATVRREAYRDRLAADGALDRIAQLTGERNQAEADVDRAEAERDRLAEQVRTLRALAEEALHLRQHGENAPGGTETWRDWDRKAPAVLRALDGTEAAT